MRAAPTRLLMPAALLALAALSAGACSPVLAAHQPSRKDVDLLSPGIPRNVLVAELGQLVDAEREAALAALRRLDDHPMPCGARRLDRVPQVIFGLMPIEPHLPRDRRHRSRLRTQHRDQVASQRHRNTITAEIAEPAGK